MQARPTVSLAGPAVSVGGPGPGLVEVTIVEKGLSAEQASRFRLYVARCARLGHPLSPADLPLAAEVVAGHITAEQFRARRSPPIVRR